MICKTVLATGQTKDKRDDKNKILLPHQTTTQFFIQHINCLKYQNNILPTQNPIRTKVIQCHKKICCYFWYCSGLYLLFVDKMHQQVTRVITHCSKLDSCYLKKLRTCVFKIFDNFFFKKIIQKMMHSTS